MLPYPYGVRIILFRIAVSEEVSTVLRRVHLEICQYHIIIYSVQRIIIYHLWPLWTWEMQPVSPGQDLTFRLRIRSLIYAYVDYLGIGMAKPSCDDLAIGISMRRGCFLITPRVFNLLVPTCATGRVRTLSKLHKCLHPTGRMGSTSMILWIVIISCRK